MPDVTVFQAENSPCSDSRRRDEPILKINVVEHVPRRPPEKILAGSRHLFRSTSENCCISRQTKRNGDERQTSAVERWQTLNTALQVCVIISSQKAKLKENSGTKANGTKIKTDDYKPQKEETTSPPIHGATIECTPTQRHPACGRSEASKQEEGEAVRG